MVQTVRIEAVAREKAGKGAARATRRQGLVPGVIYGAKQAAKLIAVDPRVLKRELHREGWQSHLYEVIVDGSAERCLLRDVQFHPVTDRPIHVDFQRLAPGARIRVKVPVHFLNEDLCPGLKAGGVLNVVRREIEVMADPDHVPAAFEVDLAQASIGAALRWSAVRDNFGTKPVILGRDFMIASIAAPTVMEETANAPTAPAQVEAIRQKAPAAGASAKDAKAQAKDAKKKK